MQQGIATYADKISAAFSTHCNAIILNAFILVYVEASLQFNYTPWVIDMILYIQVRAVYLGCLDCLEQKDIEDSLAVMERKVVFGEKNFLQLF